MARVAFRAGREVELYRREAVRARVKVFPEIAVHFHEPANCHAYGRVVRNQRRALMEVQVVEERRRGYDARVFRHRGGEVSRDLVRRKKRHLVAIAEELELHVGYSVGVARVHGLGGVKRESGSACTSEASVNERNECSKVDDKNDTKRAGERRKTSYSRRRSLARLTGDDERHHRVRVLLRDVVGWGEVWHGFIQSPPTPRRESAKAPMCG